MITISIALGPKEIEKDKDKEKEILNTNLSHTLILNQLCLILNSS